MYKNWYRFGVELATIIFVVGCAWATIDTKIKSHELGIKSTNLKVEILSSRLERIDARQEIMLSMLKEIKEDIK